MFATKWDTLKKRPLFNLGRLLLVFAVTTLICIAVFKIAGLLAPFVLALLCSLAMEPLIRLITRKTKKGFQFPRSIASLIILLVFGGLLIFLLVLLGIQLVEQAAGLLQEIPKLLPQIINWLSTLLENLEHQIEIFPIAFPDDFYYRITSSLYTWASELTRYSNTVVRGVWNTASALPGVLFFVIMWLVGTYYFAAWRPRIVNFIDKSAPSTWIVRMTAVKDRLFKTLFGYLRAQLILMLAVFFVMFIAFSIMRFEYALLFALVIAFFDMLPVLGSGLFLNTGAAFCLLTGNYYAGIGMFLTWIAVIIVRNSLEPRLVSFQIGLPPLVTMAAMYAGLRLIGFLGLIAGPILMIILLIVYEYYAHGRTLREVLLGEEPAEKKDEMQETDLP